MTPSRPTSPEVVPSGATLHLSTPLRLGLVVVVAMAVVALTFLLLPRDTPPIGQGSPSPPATAAQPSPSLAPSVTPDATSTPTPTPSATLAPTPAATPASTPAWIGLDWSDPATPSSVIHLYDLVPWRDGYVAGGTVGEGSTRAAFLTSPDGLEWTQVYAAVYRGDPATNRWPRHLLAFDGGLMAFSHAAATESQLIAYDGPLVWEATSSDGSTWGRAATAGWEGAWTDAAGPVPNTWVLEQHQIEIGLADVAASPDSIVAIGNSYADDGNGMVPVILHSTDGHAWAPAALPAGSDSALLNAIVEHHGRFVITGAVGIGPDPADATAAAWYSDDGLTWVRATIEPAEVDLISGAELGPLWTAADGLVACRGSREMTAGGWRYMDGWTSTDGATWRHSPQPGPHPACDWSASDGTRIVSLGPRDHASPTAWPGVTTASVSTDGITWQPLELSTTLTDRLERFWVVPDGVIYAGVQSFWFGTAIER